MAVPPPPSPSVYRTRAYTARRRVLYALAAVGLVLVGYLIGRWQDTPAAPLPVAATAGASAVPSSAPPTTTPPPSPTVYRKLQAETADALNGIQTQDTEDEGGGQNVGWIANGDSLRFDAVDFGPVPATKLDVRVASDSDGGRMDIRLDSPDADPIGALRVTRTGGWQNWRTDEVTLRPVTGVHTVFLTFARDDDDEFVNLNWLQFAH
ncbi:carbohydrate-binding protein [Actinoplanes sp. KI2]|uniref:carbohydrate-binding protein n=1 Tax=Actinoplanes sp. KI2 TaxID=2983315 RepID=UPI0021D5AB47|nr:carbohydrate-binding protein [Actinoplanes sp. KI2]MCU7728529.1 carbohydrate-binding protein [Actinoplanes sp. KI2]